MTAWPTLRATLLLALPALAVLAAAEHAARPGADARWPAGAALADDDGDDDRDDDRSDDDDDDDERSDSDDDDDDRGDRRGGDDRRDRDDDDDDRSGRRDRDDNDDDDDDDGDDDDDAPRMPAGLPARSDSDSDDRVRRQEISAARLRDADLAALQERGYRVIRAHRSSSGIVARLAPPRRLGDRAALRLAIQTAPAGIFDLSHVYAPNADVYARVVAGLPGRGACMSGGRIGLIDTAVADHPSLAGTRIRREDFSGGAASVAHGTAVASVIAGRTPAGGRLVEGAELYAAAVFSGREADLAADAIDLVSALDWMIDNRVPVVNLSIAGPPNALIADAVARSHAEGMILVAAAGNGGPRGGPRYPAAYPSVVAVTATDRRGRIYRRASAGPYIDIAAPGVGVWAADLTAPEGAEWTGTSFAAPFVTVELAAARKAGHVRDSASAMAWLARSARDLGNPGRDGTFGLGMMQAQACR